MEGEKGRHVAVWRGKALERYYLSELDPQLRMCSRLSVYVDPRLELLCRRAMPE